MVVQILNTQSLQESRSFNKGMSSNNLPSEEEELNP